MRKALSKKNLWEKTPPLLKSTLGAGLGVFPPAWLLGHKFRSSCRFVQESQWWPAQRGRQYQLDKLRHILTLAYEKTAYYRRAFDSAGFHTQDLFVLDDMKKLPIIDKQVIIDNLSDMCTKSVKALDVDFVSTGGTSAAPLPFYLDAGRSSVEYSYLTASWQRAGFNLGHPMAVFRGRVVNPDQNGLRHEYDPILRNHYYSNFHMNDENMARYLEHIATLGPCFLHVYPSSVSALARFILRSGVESPKNIKGIIAESEITYPEQRKMVEEVLDVVFFHATVIRKN